MRLPALGGPIAVGATEGGLLDIAIWQDRLRCGPNGSAAAIVLTMALVACSTDHSPAAVAAARSKAKLAMICRALDSYRQDYGSWPQPRQGWAVLIGKDRYLRSHDALVDEWGREIEPIVSEGAIVGASVIGPDGRDDAGRAQCRADRP